MKNQYRQITWEDWAYETRVSTAMRAFTDYPLLAFGDKPGEKAPVRECWVLSYDGGKYVTLYLEQDNVHHVDQVKIGYVYRTQERGGVAKMVDRWKLRDSRNKPAWRLLKRRYTKTEYHLWRRDYDECPLTFATLRETLSKIRNGDPAYYQGDLWFQRSNHHHDGSIETEHDFLCTVYEDPPSISWAQPVKKFRRNK